MKEKRGEHERDEDRGHKREKWGGVWEEEQKEEDGFPQAVVHATAHVNCKHKETHTKPEASPEPLSAASKSHCISPHRVYVRAIQAVNFPPAASCTWQLVVAHVCVYVCTYVWFRRSERQKKKEMEIEKATYLW